MKQFDSLYKQAVNAAVNNDLRTLFQNRQDCDERHLDCLLNPERHAPVVRLGACTCEKNGEKTCENVCFYNALSRDEKGNAVISAEDCVGCGECVLSCCKNNLTDIRDCRAYIRSHLFGRARLRPHSPGVYKPVQRRNDARQTAQRF